MAKKSDTVDAAPDVISTKEAANGHDMQENNRCVNCGAAAWWCIENRCPHEAKGHGEAEHRAAA